MTWARVTLLCHGATASTRTAAFPVDPPLLTDECPDRSRLIARLGRPDRCLSSPARAAAQTADALGLGAESNPSLRDCDFGHWAGQTVAAVQAADPDGFSRWMADREAAPHGGETLAAVSARVEAWLAESSRSRARILAITHPLVVRLAAVLCLGVPWATLWRLDAEPLSLTRLTAHEGRWRLASLNETV